MTIAYLMNTYPTTSSTFVRREIHALERQGAQIQRYAVRRWSENLVEPADVAEAGRTTYLLTGNYLALLTALAKEFVTNPRGLLRGLKAMLGLVKAAGRPEVAHLAYLVEAIFLRQDARRKGIEHVHAHYSSNASAVAMIARALGGPSYSFTAHGPDEFDSARERAIGAKLAGAAFAIAISHYCKSRLMLYGGPEHARKIHIVHCGITPDDFEHTRPITADNRTLVCVGRLCTQKAQVLLPAVAAALRKDFPGLRIVMIGDGESRGDIERGIAEHGVGDVIELRGWRSNAEVREAIAGCRAVLLPSFAEGLPVIIMEAFASGRPVISTYIAGIPEILDQSTGWIVPAGDQEALAEALRAALAASPAELQRMGARGRAIVVREFDIDTEARRLLGHLRNAIAAERAGAGSAVARTGLAVRAGSNVRRT